MISNVVTSINAEFTKFVGEIINKSFKAPETKKKIVNLEDLKKVQATSEIGETGEKIIRYDESLIQCPKYNKKGKTVEPERHYLDILR